MARKYSPSASKDVEREMHKLKRGQLKSGKAGKGGTVKSRKVALQYTVEGPFAEMNAVEGRQWLSARRSMKMRKEEDLDLQDETVWRARRLKASYALRAILTDNAQFPL